MKDWAGRKSVGKVSTLFTAYDDKLMMGVDSGHLLELDSATGNVLRECYPSYSLPLAQSEAAVQGLFSVNNLALSDDKTRLFNMDITWLAETDLTDFSLKQALHLSQLDSAVLQITGFMQQGGYFYFAATHNKTFGARALGVMDVVTHELLWYEDVAIAGSEFFMKGDAPKIAGKLLWIQDTVGTLYIYERS